MTTATTSSQPLSPQAAYGKISHTAYLVLPGIGSVFTQRETVARGRTYFDTDLDLRDDGMKTGIELFIGKWQISMSKPKAGLTDRAWLYVAVPVLVVSSVAVALVTGVFWSAWRGAAWLARGRALGRV